MAPLFTGWLELQETGDNSTPEALSKLLKEHWTPPYPELSLNRDNQDDWNVRSTAGLHLLQRTFGRRDVCEVVY